MEMKILFVALLDLLAFAGACILEIISYKYTVLVIMLAFIGLALTMLLDILVKMYDDKKLEKK